jgi:hypothetical protein
MYKKIAVIAVLLVLVAAACGGDDKKSDKPDATNTPAATPIPDLTETYTAANGISIQYPKGWFVGESTGMIALSNVELPSPTTVMTSGQTGLIIFDPFLVQMMSAGDEISLSELLNRFITGMGAQGIFGGGGEVTVGEIVEAPLGEKPAARLLASTAQMEGLVMAIDLGDQVLVVMGGAAKGESGLFEDILLAMADTITYTAP